MADLLKKCTSPPDDSVILQSWNQASTLCGNAGNTTEVGFQHSVNSKIKAYIPPETAFAVGTQHSHWVINTLGAQHEALT